MVARRAHSISSRCSRETWGSKSSVQTQFPFFWHTSREISKITGPERPNSVNWISPVLQDQDSPSQVISALHKARTPFNAPMPGQSVLICTRLGRSRVHRWPKLRKSLYPDIEPPSLVPARPPQATIRRSQKQVLSAVSMEKPPCSRLTFCTSAPVIREILGFSRANRSTSTTELAWSEWG